ncbi:NUDIX domain-containing protein [Salinivibrio sp. MA351]|uniref:NUDIX domain-containing protein n=1 Tax=Salinivibrio sp. MA351 TaxID=1909453 RepID=UPI0009892EDB|nr:NUDIX domain-containing protein [Salinivibrio sp. MA351]OOE96254.1 NUDIX domain-containing protein [Salinivibrio sp. MA351]
MIERLVPHDILDSLDKYDRIVVGGIISVAGHDDRVLFLKRSKHEFMPDAWEIPSGGIEEGESMLKALKREIKEETNLEVFDVGGFVSAVDYLAKDNKCLQLNFNVCCRGDVQLSNEHSEFIFSKIDSFVNNLDDFMLRVIKPG